MKPTIEFPEMLEQLSCPAFVVKEGIIVRTNQSAQQLQISPDTKVADLISTGAEEYASFTDGKLCLTLKLFGTPMNAVVIKDGASDVFYLAMEYNESELRAFALAAQHLREPLANALTCTNRLLPSAASEGSKEIQEQLSQLNKNLYRLHRAVCNMSDTARYQNSRTSRMEYREVGSIFSEIMEKAANYLSGEVCTLTYTVPHECINTMVDTEKLERALLNMISNAAKFAPAGSEIHADLHTAGKKIYFSVENKTAGIPQTARMFSYYLRQPGIEDPKSGIGLGMSIVQKTAAMHGGTLLLEEREDHLRFTMTIPIRNSKTTSLRSEVRLPFDYSGGYDHTLIELSDVLPKKYYR